MTMVALCNVAIGDAFLQEGDTYQGSKETLQSYLDFGYVKEIPAKAKKEKQAAPDTTEA